MYKFRSFKNVSNGKKYVLNNIKRIFDNSNSCEISLYIKDNYLCCYAGSSALYNAKMSATEMVYEDGRGIHIYVGDHNKGYELKNEIINIFNKNKYLNNDIGIFIFNLDSIHTRKDSSVTKIVIFKISELTAYNVSGNKNICCIYYSVKKDDLSIVVHFCLDRDKYVENTINEISETLKKNNRYDLLMDNLL